MTRYVNLSKCRHYQFVERMKPNVSKEMGQNSIDTPESCSRQLASEHFRAPESAPFLPGTSGTDPVACKSEEKTFNDHLAPIFQWRTLKKRRNDNKSNRAVCRTIRNFTQCQCLAKEHTTTYILLRICQELMGICGDRLLEISKQFLPLGKQLGSAKTREILKSLCCPRNLITIIDDCTSSSGFSSSCSSIGCSDSASEHSICFSRVGRRIVPS